MNTTNIFELNVFNEDINAIISMKEYKLFDESLNEFDHMFDDEFVLTEEVIDNRGSIRKKIRREARKSANITDSTVKAAGSITRLGGAVMKTQWTIFAGCWKLCANVLSFLAKGFEKIPIALEKSIRRIEKLPSNIMGKIRGDISLNITAGDFQEIYSTGITVKMREYMALMKKVSTGNGWGNVMHFFQIGSHRLTGSDSAISSGTAIGKASHAIGSTAKSIGSLLFGNDDINDIKRMHKIAKGIDAIQLNPTSVRIDKANNVAVYFSDEKHIHFVDHKGVQYKLTYLEALQKLMNDLKETQESTKILQEKFGAKLDKTEVSQKLARMNYRDRELVNEVLSESAEVLGKIGKMINAIVKDIKTINDGYTKVMQKANSK